MKIPFANHICCLLAATACLLIGSVFNAGAQLVADGATATINGTSISLPADLTIGTNGSFTTLQIINGGSVTNAGSGNIGLNGTAKTNQVLVTGANSIWGIGGNMT